MRGLRITVGVLLALTFALLLPIALTSWWAENRIDDADGYVEVVSGVIDDPAVRAEVDERLTEELVQALGSEFPDAPQIAGAAVDEVLDSDGFAEGWTAANREAHEQIVAILRGDATAADGDVTVSLAGLYNAAADVLASEGVTLAERPEGSLQFRTAPPQRLEDAQSGYQALVGAGTWLPVVTLVLLVAAVAIPPGRSRIKVALIAAIGGVVTSGILLAALAAGGEVAALQVQAEDRDLAEAVLDVLLGSLSSLAWTAIVIGLIAAVLLIAVPLVVDRRRRPAGSHA